MHEHGQLSVGWRAVVPAAAGSGATEAGFYSRNREQSAERVAAVEPCLGTEHLMRIQHSCSSIGVDHKLGARLGG